MTQSASDPRVEGAVVVGVDGSEDSKQAFRWAARQAKLMGATLVAAIAWDFPLNYGYPALWPDGYDPADEAKRLLDDTIDEVVSREQGIEVIGSVAQGHAALTLENLSRSASLLVVGSRGHGQFVGMLLGSVSEFLATHAHCPLVIVRSSEPSEQPAAT
jgi:nucleotide-binding universal stress UspA family protein